MFVLGVAAVISTGIVIVTDTRAAADESAWMALDIALRSEDRVVALEGARERAKGTSAEAWAACDLAFALYEVGGEANLRRAQQVAQQALASVGDPALAPMLKQLLAVLLTYAG